MVAAAAIGAVVGGGAQIVAGNKAAKAQKKGAKAAADASQAATDAQVGEARRQYDQTREDFTPFRETGYRALDTLANLYMEGPNKIDPTATLRATPGYQFQMDEGLKAIDRGNAARGILDSGGADKARLRYAQGIADTTYNQFANRLAAMAGVGQSATGSTAAAGAQATNTIAGAYNQNGANQAAAATNAANATASSYANTGAAISGMTTDLANIYFNRGK
jgi:hypothetical protein